MEIALPDSFSDHTLHKNKAIYLNEINKAILWNPTRFWLKNEISIKCLIIHRQDIMVNDCLLIFYFKI